METIPEEDEKALAPVDEPPFGYVADDELPEPALVEPELEEVTVQLDQAVERTEVQKCKTKKDYICQIKKRTDKYSDRELVRTKKSDLKDMLAEEFENSIQKVQHPPEIEITPDKN